MFIAYIIIAIIIINLKIINKYILTLMYTYTFKDQKQKPNPAKISPLPDLQQPAHLFALPPLPFYAEASEPLNINQYHKLKQEKQTIKQQIEKCQAETNQWQEKYNLLNQQYMRLCKDYEHLKNQYKQGEHLFRNMEDSYIKMKQQLEQLKAKKLEKSKISLGVKKKQKEIPIVKISVPNPKALAQQNQKDSIYRQLKTASQQLTQMRRMLQSEKQKSEQMQNYMSKNIQQISIQRDNAKKQINYLKQENKSLKDQLGKQKSMVLNTVSSVKNISIQTTSEYQKLKGDLERLQRVHKSCNILLASKDNQVSLLKMQIEKLNDKLKTKNQDSGKGILGFDQSRRISNSFLYQRSPKEFIETNAFLPQSSVKKYQNISFEGQSQQNYTQMLEQHLNLSVKQMKSVEQLIKGIVSSFINKIEQLKNELEWANKKAEHQKFELQRVYELLRDKKQQVDNCYKDLRNAGRNSKSTPVKDTQRDDEFLKSILKGRRDLSA